MTGKKLQRVLACLLAVLLLSQVGAFSPAVFAADSSGYTLHDGTAVIPAGTSAGDVNRILAAALVEGFDQMTAEEQDAIVNKGFEYQCHFMKGSAPSLKSYWGSVAGGTTKKEGLGKLSVEYTCPALADNKDGDYKVRLAGTTAEVTLTKAEKLSSSITLKEGVSVKLPYNEDGTLNADALRAAIFAQVVENTTPELMVSNVTIEYYATAESGSAGNIGKEWMPLEGGTKDLLTYPAISAGDQQIQISFKGDDTYKASSETTTVTFTERADSHIVLKSGQKVALPYTDATTVDFDALRAAILQQVVSEDITPVLTTENTEIKYKFTFGLTDTWVDLTGGTIAPAVSAKSYEIQISFKGDDAYKASSETTTVTFTERPGIEAVTKENPTFKLAFTADGEAIYDNIRQQVWGAVVVSTNPALTVDDVTIEYYATATTGALGEWGHAWMPLEGGEAHTLTYPAIGEGTQQVRITWGGSKNYAPWSWEGDVVVTGRAAAPFQLKQGVTEVGIVYNADQSINYAETAQALREALIESTDSAVSINDLTVEYNAGTRELKNFQPLDFNGIGFKFGLNGQTIRFTWRGNADYMAYTQEVDVTMVDNRQPTEVMLKSGASITYNMDAKVMLQAIFENLIDWDASKLPEKSTLTLDDFTIEYYATAEVVAGDLSGDMDSFKDWVSIEGKGVTLGKLQLLYPQMGAGEQQIRVTFKGDEAYRPSTPIEGNLTVNKAKVSVKVHSTSIYADEAKDKLGEGFVTTDPADKFDIYTIYGGMTSDVTTSVFVQLPERITNNKLLELIDETLHAAGKPTLSEIIQEGTTVGELKEYLNDLLNSDALTALGGLLSKVGIDLDTLRQISDTLNKLPGLLDNVRVAFGVPDQAGIYTVYAITNNKNYETGVGTGMLLVKKHYSGVKLQWNQTIPNGKLTVEEAKNFDFKATLSYNGNSDISQDNVHYLYSGFTSKWRPYSSTTTPPTEPGRYVVTVVTLGGNYQAAPITRAFQITK